MNSKLFKTLTIRILFFAPVLFMLFAIKGYSLHDSKAQKQADKGKKPSYVSGTVLVKLKPSQFKALQAFSPEIDRWVINKKGNKSSLFKKQKASSRKQFQTPSQDYGLDRWMKVETGSKQGDPAQLCRELMATGEIEHCQPNYFYTAQGEPEEFDDPFLDLQRRSWGQSYPDLWGLYKSMGVYNPADLQQVWSMSQGEHVVVAVVDTGLDDRHPDLCHDANENGICDPTEQSNIWTNPGEQAGDANQDGFAGVKDVDDDDDGLIDEDSQGCASNRLNADGESCVWLNDLVSDDDENGYGDDVSGYDFTTCAAFSGDACLEPKSPDPDPMDGHGHGTHVSGTIAAVGGNGIGMVGVAPKSKIMPLKGLADIGGGLSSELAQAIIYAADMGADVINNSWGCVFGCPSNPVVEDAVRHAHGAGAVIVFAAGNSASDVSNFSPQNMRETITVASVDHLDQRSDFSNFGTLIDVAAPGGESGEPCSDFLAQSILSLRAGGTDMFAGCGDGWPEAMAVEGLYYRARGTSMAAPHTAGVIALIRAHRPEFTNEEVKQVLQVSADDVGTLGFDVETGAGRINARAALLINSIPQLEITSPASGTNLNELEDTLTITGTAAGEDFAQYELFYHRKSVPGDWIPIGGPVRTPVVNGNLGTWFFGDLPDDHYTLRLTVTVSSGRVFHEFVELIKEVMNQIPVFEPFEPLIEAREGGEVIFDVTVCDGDRDELQGAMTSTPDRFRGGLLQSCFYNCTPFCSIICEPCGRFSHLGFILGYQDAGTYDVHFNVDDGRNGLASAATQLVVHNTNRPPKVPLVGPIPKGREEDLSTFDVVAQDDDLDDELAIRMSDIPEGAELKKVESSPGSATYRFSWVPKMGQAGWHSIQIFANDGYTDGFGTFALIQIEAMPAELVSIVKDLGPASDSFISPLADNVPFNRFKIQLTRPVELIRGGAESTGGTAPKVTGLVDRGGGNHEVTLSGGIPVGAWTKVTLQVKAKNAEAESLIEVHVAHLPADINQSGNVTLDDIFTFYHKIGGLHPLELVDMNGSGTFTFADVLAFLKQWRKWLFKSLPPKL